MIEFGFYYWGEFMAYSALSLMIVFFLSIYVLIMPANINKSLMIHYQNYRHKLSEFAFALSFVSVEKRFLFFTLSALVYYTFVYISTSMLLLINVLGLGLIINFRWILIHYKKLKRDASKRGDHPLSIEESSREIQRLINHFLPQYFAFIFYFVIGGLPITAIYAYYLLTHRNGKVIEYWLFLPTRIYWLIMLVVLWIFSQGCSPKYQLNFKQRNLTNTMNGTWLESLIAGLFNTQIIMHINGEQLLIGENQQNITFQQVLWIFYALNLSPFILVFLY